MKYEFTPGPGFDFVTAFAAHFHLPVFRNSVVVPASMGDGFIKNMEFDEGIKLVMHHYTLKEEFHLKRLSAAGPGEYISIIFNSNELPTGSAEDRQEAIRFLKNSRSAIQIASSSLGTETLFAAGSEVFFVVIGIPATVLRSILSIEQTNSVVERILSGSSSFFFHENMSVDEGRIVEQLFRKNEVEQLGRLYYRIKIEELIYLLFTRLLARESSAMSTIYKADIEKLYAIRTAIIADVSIPPRLNELAKMAGMSETKMKALFKQIFGDTIYNYYQKERLEEAAFLIRHAGYAVSEAGYQLGFTNLSHFSRLFEKHHGLTPKKYSYVG